MRGAPHARLVLLAQTRRGYGNLSEWITVARRRAPKGQYLAHPSDLEGRVPNAPTLAGLPGCFALLLPRAGQPFEEVFAHAMWLKTWFQDERCAIAVELLHRADDEQLLETVQRVAQVSGLPLVAAGGVLHARALAQAAARRAHRHAPRRCRWRSAASRSSPTPRRTCARAAG